MYRGPKLVVFINKKTRQNQPLYTRVESIRTINDERTETNHFHRDSNNFASIEFVY